MSANKQNTAFLQLKVKDRIGLVNEICGIIQSLDIDILSHGANVYTERSGVSVSYFRARLASENSGSFLMLQRRCGRIKGFISVSCGEAV